jgi:fibronectin type 3 domain-containing protein
VRLATAPVRVAALDTNGDDIADAILAVQGPGGTTGQIRVFEITNVSPLEVSPFTTVPGSFPQPYFIATSAPTPAVTNSVAMGSLSTRAFFAPAPFVPAFSASFDFGSTKSPVEPGSQLVAPGTKYSEQTGFGWLSGSIKALDRRTGSALDRDANLTSNGTFVVDVPNGSYAVTVRLGDLGRTVRDEMAVFLQGVQVDLVTTAARSVESRTYQLAVTDGRLTLNLRDLGGRDKSVSITGLVVTAVTPDIIPPTVTIGSAAGQTAPVTDTPFVLNVVFSKPVSEFSAADVQWTWTGAGGLTSTVSGSGAAYQIAVSGMESNGTLQAEIGAHAAFDLSGNANLETISAAIEYRYEKRFDFGNTKSPVEPGYQSVAHRTKYSVQTGFGWLSGSIKALDRRTGSALDRDANLTSNGTFVVDVPNGSYTVTVRLGDLGRTVRDEMAVFLQGVQVDLVTTAARSVESQTYEVAVTNGQLMLQLMDLGGRDKSVSITALTIVNTSVVPSVIPAGEGEADWSLDVFEFMAPVRIPAAPLPDSAAHSVPRDRSESDLDYDTVWPQATGIESDLDPVTPARSPFDQDDDLLGLDAMLADIVLDVARGWNLSA